MDTPSPSARMMGLINGFLVTQSLYVVATLGVADLLANGPRDAEDLARLTGAKADQLYRVMRALAAIGVFHETEDRRFSLTELGDCLRRDAPEPVGAWAVNVGRPYFWAANGALLDNVRSGDSGFRLVHGTDPWDYRARHLDESVVFDRAMTDLSRRVSAGVAAGYDFAPFSVVVDIGGGNGALLSAILAAHPGLRGVLFDQPHVVPGSAAVLAAAGVADRCEAVGGSFFDAVPSGGDAYVMKSVLHDWEDADAVAILKVCRAAMAPLARLLVVEHVIEPPNAGPATKFMDITMMVMLGARERTEADFALLLAAGGFALTRVVNLGNGFSVIEAEPR